MPVRSADLEPAPARVRAAYPAVCSMAKKPPADKARGDRGKGEKPKGEWAKAEKGTGPAAHGGAPRPPVRPAPPRPRPAEPSPALLAFEKALERIHKQDWRGALEQLQQTIANYPGEPEVLDRARIYLRVAERNLKPKAPEPKSVEELYLAGLFKLNAGELEAAVVLLERAVAGDSRLDAGHYALACAHALRRDRARAIKHLKAAIELDPTHRIHAAGDSDFELLRDDAEFIELLAPAPAARAERD